MTTDRVPVDDLGVLRHVLTTTDALFLDFDGPICAVFSNFPAREVAAQLRGVLADGGHTGLPDLIAASEDPFEVLEHAATLGAEEIRYTEAALRAHEVEAVTAAKPTAGAVELIRAWNGTGRPLAVVSNNSQAAVSTYLHLHDLAGLVHTVSARTEPEPSKLKPNPLLLHRASEAMAVPTVRCTLVGDSLTDLQAAHRARSRAIGYANKVGKSALFAAEHPSAITTSMTHLSRALLL
ncbi:HAD family hydrolase [Actinosynnema mirum]|uniref:Haloacid dehalogenase domain protein hydrolase n=1 Tax=Actinosynnema mirum (strain ATCC 29888 / DSM 43827 / JCM 3225 / NBRC 14064 / NCIMB 13271 / NRRL B-12336 / IMRU 3971 / 101) TaxID=446462 RepID=C6WME2_ACTMD|nr:HAD family phosphatase [Actinosynnema mirum]ACU34876.1 Haloacid dehalogenase domain protein hydrolase [Actinosynnema mirum DSM 43827]